MKITCPGWVLKGSLKVSVARLGFARMPDSPAADRSYKDCHGSASGLQVSLLKTAEDKGMSR